MNKPLHRKAGIAFVSLLLVCSLCSAGCATRVNNIWKDDAYQGGRPQKVLVIGVAKSDTVRRFFETECARRFKDHGIDAVESFTFISDEAMGEAAGRDMLVAKIKELGIDAVLMTRSMGTRTETESMPGYTIYSAPFGSYGGWNSYYGAAYAYPIASNSGSSWERSTFITMETHLYDVKTEKLIWSMRSETNASGLPEEEIKPYVNVVMKKLFSANLFK